MADHQKLVDETLMAKLPGGGNLSSAAIVGLDGSVKAKSPDFPDLSQGEVETLVAAFDNDTLLDEKGFTVGGVKYVAIQGDPGSVIRGRKGEGGGVVAKKAGDLIVIGLHGDGVRMPECTTVVEEVGDKLIS